MNNFLKAATFCLMILFGGSDGALFPYLNFAGIIGFGGLFLFCTLGDKPSA